VVAGLAGIGKQYLLMLALGQRGFNRRGLLEDLAAALGCSVAHRNGETIRLSSQLQRISPRRPGQAYAETALCALGTLVCTPRRT
jgi:hypothetical protein